MRASNPIKTDQDFNQQEIQFSSLQELNEALQKEIKEKLNILNSAFSKAFADKKQDHPSQLLYIVLWEEVSLIFREIEQDLSLETAKKNYKSVNDIKQAFNNLTLENLVKNIMPLYRSVIEGQIKTNELLKKKLGNYIQKLDPEIYMSLLSNDKKEIFPHLVKAFKSLALQKYGLIENSSKQLRSLNSDVSSALIKAYNEKIESIKKVLTPYKSVVESSDVISELNKKIVDEKQRKHSISIVNQLIQNRKLAIFQLVQKGYNPIEKEANKILKFCRNLRINIQAYQQEHVELLRLLKQKDLNEHDHQLILARLYSHKEEYKKLSEKIDGLSNLNDSKNNLISLINEEKAAVSKITFSVNSLTEEEMRKAIPLLQEIAGHVNSLNNQIGFYTRVGDTVTPTSGLLFEAYDSLTTAIDRINKFYPTNENMIDKMLISQEMDRARKQERKSYNQCLSKTAVIGQQLITSCEKQSFAGNDLWDKDAVNAVHACTVNWTENQRLFLAPSDSKEMSSLLEAEVNILISSIKNIQKNNKVALNNELLACVNRFEKIQEQLKSVYDHFLRFLQTTEFNEYQQTVTAAKNECIQNLEKLKELVDKVDLGKDLSVSKNLSSPNELDKIIEEKNRLLEEQNRLLKENEDEINRQNALEVAKQKKWEETERKKQQIRRRKIENQKIKARNELFKKYGIENGDFTSCMLVIANLDALLKTILDQDIDDEEWINLKEEYHQLNKAWDLTWVQIRDETKSDVQRDCIAHYLSSLDKLKIKVEKKQKQLGKGKRGGDKNPFRRSDDISRLPTLNDEGIKAQLPKEKRGFWSRYKKVIIVSTLAGAAIGAAAGIALGAATAFAGAPVTFGLSILATPVAMAIFGAVFAAAGAVAGFVGGVTACVIDNCTHPPRPLMEVVAEEKQVLLSDSDQERGYSPDYSDSPFVSLSISADNSILSSPGNSPNNSPVELPKFIRELSLTQAKVKNDSLEKKNNIEPFPIPTQPTLSTSPHSLYYPKLMQGELLQQFERAVFEKVVYGLHSDNEKIRKMLTWDDYKHVITNNSKNSEDSTFVPGCIDEVLREEKYQGLKTENLIGTKYAYLASYMPQPTVEQKLVVSSN